MADRTANVKLTLSKSAFSDGIKGAGDEIGSLHKKIAEFDANRVRQVSALKSQYQGMMQAALAPTAGAAAFSAGIKGAQASVSGLFNTLKSGIAQVAGLGGLLGGAALLQGAMKTEGTYRALAFAIKAGTGEAMDFRTVMADGAAASAKWGQDVDQLGRAMHGVWTQTGDIDFTKKSIDTIAMISRASHESVETIGDLAGGLHKHFGIANEDLGDTLSSVLSLGNKGGVSVGELANRIGFIGAAANEAGIKGKQGFDTIAGMLNFGAEGAKNFRKNLTNITGLIEELDNKTKRTKMMIAVGVSASAAGKAHNFQDAITSMLEATGGDKEKLAKGFKAPAQLQYMADLGKTYAKGFAETTGDIKTKMAGGVAAFEAELARAGKSAIDKAEMERLAAEEMKTSQVKMEAALNKIKAAFLRPEIADAVGKLADVLPKLADMIVSVVGFASEHPMAAAGIGVAAVAGKGFAGAAMSTVLRGAFAEGAALLGGGLTAAAPVAGTAIGTAIGPVAGPSIAALAGPAMGNLILVAGLGAAAASYAAYRVFQHNDEVSHGHGVEMSALNARRNLSGILGETLVKTAGGISPMLGAAAQGLYQTLGLSQGSYESERARLTGEMDPNAWEKRGQLAAADQGMSVEPMMSEYNPDDYGPRVPFVKGGAASCTANEGAPQANPDNMRVLEQLLKGELKVRLMNPEALRNGGGGFPGGSPAPGYTPNPG